MVPEFKHIKYCLSQEMLAKEASLFVLIGFYAALLASAAPPVTDTVPEPIHSAPTPHNDFRLPSVVTRVQRPSTANVGLSRPIMQHSKWSPHLSADSFLDPSYHIVTLSDIDEDEDVDRQ